MVLSFHEAKMLLQFKDPLKLKTKRVRDIIFDALGPLHFVASYLPCGERSRKSVAPEFKAPLDLKTMRV